MHVYISTNHRNIHPSSLELTNIRGLSRLCACSLSHYLVWAVRSQGYLYSSGAGNCGNLHLLISRSFWSLEIATSGSDVFMNELQQVFSNNMRSLTRVFSMQMHRCVEVLNHVLATAFKRGFLKCITKHQAPEFTWENESICFQRCIPEWVRRTENRQKYTKLFP